MEFSEKLQKLRKSRNLTQEQLAEQLFVSRTAISKWESDRGYPNIDSLKAISEFFSVSIDELLSSEGLIEVCEKTNDDKIKKTKSFMCGCLDIFVLIMFFLPLFKEKSGGKFFAVSLIELSGVMPYIKISFIVLIVLCGILGIIQLIHIMLKAEKFSRILKYVSLCLSIILVLTFIVTQEPYAAVLSFGLLIFKGILLIKKD